MYKVTCHIVPLARVNEDGISYCNEYGELFTVVCGLAYPPLLLRATSMGDCAYASCACNVVSTT